MRGIYISPFGRNDRPVKMKLKKAFAFTVIVVLLLISIWRLAPHKTYEETHLVMGTFAKIQIQDRSKIKAQIAMAKAWTEIKRLENIFNFHDSKSELSQLNDNGYRSSIKVSNDLWLVLQKSQEASVLTNGLFDMTIGSLSRLYGFPNDGKKKIPSKLELYQAVSLVNYKYVQLDQQNKTVSLQKKGVLIDLGGSAKGYAVDRAVAVLQKEGIKAGLVNIGGNIFGFGHQVWKIGIQHPRNADEILEVIKLKNNGVATSGDYERFFIKNHLRVHHIFNPKTGFSSTANIGVTVVAKDAFTADIFSTSLFVIDPVKVREIIANQGLKAILVSEGNSGKLRIDKEGL